MDMGFGPPVPGSFDSDFLDMVENEIDQQYLDPFGRTLENLENSVEQSSPLAGMPGDPSNTMFDLAEQSMEQQRFSSTKRPEYLEDNRLWDLMDALELATENQVIKPEEPIEALAPDPDEIYGSFSQAVVPRLGEAWFLRERPYHEYRMSGTQTGVRYNGSGMTYCRLYDVQVSPDACDSCNTFEPAEDITDDDKCCRYAF